MLELNDRPRDSSSLTACLRGRAMPQAMPGRVVRGSLRQGRSGIVFSLAMWVAACAHAPATTTNPQLPALTLEATTGGTLELRSFVGKVTLLDVWATWCEPCRYAMPHYRALARELGPRGFALVAISVDELDEPLDALLAAEPMPFPVLRDRRATSATALRVEAMPTCVLYDRHGRERFRHEGFVSGDEDLIRGEIEKLLAEE